MVNPLKIPCWDQTIDSLPESTFFYTQSWIDVLYKTYGFIPHFYTEQKNRTFQTIIPLIEVKTVTFNKKAISLPFTDYCDPILSHETKFKETFDTIVRIAKNNKWSKLIFQGIQTTIFDTITPLYTAEEVRHTIDITQGYDTLYSQFRDTTKRNIKTSLQNGVRIVSGDTFEYVNIFFDLHCLTRKKHKLPPQPFKFFQNIFNEIISKRRGILFLAQYESQWIAAFLFLMHKSTVIYKYGASHPRYLFLNANNLLMAEAIKYFHTNHYAQFCFGKTEIINKGLIQFKNGFRPKTIPLRTYVFDCGSNTFMNQKSKVSRLQKFVFNHMPLPVLKLMGNIFYKYAA